MKSKGARNHCVRNDFEHSRAIRTQYKCKHYDTEIAQSVVFVTVLVTPDVTEHSLETFHTYTKSTRIIVFVMV